MCQFAHDKVKGNTAEPIMAFVRTSLENAKQDIVARLEASKSSDDTTIGINHTYAFFSGV